jgi:hypothetical protein
MCGWYETSGKQYKTAHGCDDANDGNVNYSGNWNNFPGYGSNNYAETGTMSGNWGY